MNQANERDDMMNKIKVPQLRAIASPERSTAIKARESWHVLGIISEFVEATEALADIRPAVSIFGSARIKPGEFWYEETVTLARKLAFAKYATAFVAMPGGWGTLDELLEVLTLIQTRVGRTIPVILMGTSFWQGLLDWMRDVQVAQGTVSASDLDLIRVIDDPDEVIEAVFDFYQHRGFYATTEERELNLNL